jgi:hypothetical protein
VLYKVFVEDSHRGVSLGKNAPDIFYGGKRYGRHEKARVG